MLNKGDRVTMTNDAKRRFPTIAQSGIVTGWYRTGLIRVRRDGLKEADGWHPSFWRRERRRR